MNARNTEEHYIEYEGLTRDDDDAPIVRVYFTADGWQPYVPATWEQPAEGGMFEDIHFLRAEIDPRDASKPLTEAEIGEARYWFENDWRALDSRQGVAIKAMEEKRVR